MNETFFEGIKRVIDEGGKINIINRKEVELDITNDFRVALIDYFAAETALHKMIDDREIKLKVKDIDIKVLKDTINKQQVRLNILNKYKKIVDNVSVKSKIDKNSPEALLKAKLDAEGFGQLRFNDKEEDEY